jgi:hypothetical protein
MRTQLHLARAHNQLPSPNGRIRKRNTDGLAPPALCALGVRRLLFHVCLEHQPNVVGQRALRGVGAALQLIAFGTREPNVHARVSLHRWLLPWAA